LEISSTSNQPEQTFEMVFCGPIAPSVGSRKGIIIYKTMNRIFALRKHLELLHLQLWNEWVDQKKDGFKAEKQPSRKRFGPTPSNILNFFASVIPYSKDNFNQE